MKKIILGILVLSSFSTFASETSCEAKLEAIEDQIIDITLGDLPAMAIPSKQGEGYQMQYGIMLGTTTNNYKDAINLLKEACRDAEIHAQLVKDKEI